MSELAPLHELTLRVEQVLFEDVTDAEIHHRCKLIGEQFRASALGFPASAALADALRLTVGHRLNGDHFGARAWEAVAGALLPLAKRERAEEIARLERRRMS
jgi:hypothetical protein